jgi:transglutaminase-like putative cysteine protease
MEESELMGGSSGAPVALALRLGCELVYYTARATPALMVVRPVSTQHHRVEAETYTFHPAGNLIEEVDVHGNRVDRMVLQPGTTTIRHDAIVKVSSHPEAEMISQRPVPVEQLPMSLLRYTMPSRYCDSDRLMGFASQYFDSCEPGGATVRAICNWVHKNIEYRYGTGSSFTAASDILAQGYGVCRDFAHVVVALCRTFNLPARYLNCHLSDIGGDATGSEMDFHAAVEVYLDGEWYAVDARFNEPRIGRVKIASGMDAAEAALSTFYGGADLVKFTVWNYQIDPASHTLNDPVDETVRLDYSSVVQIPPNAEPF